MKELENVPKELKGSATLYEEQQYELTSTPPPDLLSLVTYVAEDGLVGHQWKERPLVLQRSYARVGWGAEREEGIGDFGDSI